MVNIILILTAIIVFVVLLIINTYILAYFQSEEDKNTAYFPKIVVVFGLTLSCVTVLLLPMDNSNHQSDGGLDMRVWWFTAYIVIAAFLLIVIPFAIFYYESDDGIEEGQRESQIWNGVKWTILVFFVSMVVIGLSYVFLNKSEIPYKNIQSELVDPTTLSDINDFACGNKCISTDETLEVHVSFFVYLIAILSFFGWLLFILFGGIGVVALPMDLINNYRTRPQPIELQEYAQRKITLGERASRLLAEGTQLKEKGITPGKMKGRSQKKQYNRFKRNVFVLENEFEKLQIAYRQRGGSPLWWWFQLFLGLLGIILSFCWILHVILYMLIDPPVTPFLNDLFIELDSFFPLFGTAGFGLFAFYLLWCVIKGNMKFGLRLIFFPIHPMKIGATMMTSFLFNVLLILISSVAVTQFCAQAFNQFTRLTAADMIFSVQIKYIVGLQYFWEYYLYAFLVLAGLSFLYLLCFPKDKAKDSLKRLDEKDPDL